jgi:hypothetical protein
MFSGSLLPQGRRLDSPAYRQAGVFTGMTTFYEIINIQIPNYK